MCGILGHSDSLRDRKGTDFGAGWLGHPHLRIDAQLHCRMDIKQFLGYWLVAHSFAHHCGFPADVTVRRALSFADVISWEYAAMSPSGLGLLP